ncbi:MAG: TlpA disulfide reductase family protein [Nocardioides marinisabuli]|uniref:TlpA family protein disulfide reductase n=1 Tax=Nocardioides marinisabuli TaxID=419476 RepID=UPI00321B1BC2
MAGPVVIRGRRLLGTLTILATVVGVLAVLLWPEEPGGPRATPSGREVDLVQQYAPSERTQVSDFTARLLDGSTMDSATLRDQVTVINVWGSWCGPCREEAPVLSDLAEELKGRVRFLGINVRDSPDAARAFERSFDIPYPSVHPDESAGVLLAFNGMLTSAAVPTTVVLDPSFSVAARVLGPVDATTLRGLVEDTEPR